MVDITINPGSDPKRATLSELAMETVQAANHALNLANNSEQLSKTAWDLATKMGDPATTESAKVGLDHARARATDAIRVVAIAQATAQGTVRTLEAQQLQALMSQAETGAEQRARASDELMRAANSQAASLKWATWALAGATVVLVLATVALIFVTAMA